VNENSWHYRLVKFSYTKLVNKQSWEDNKPKTLCGYFWKFWGYNLAALWIGVLLTAAASFFTIAYPIFAWAAFRNHSPVCLTFFIVDTIVWAALGGLFGYVYLKDNWWKVRLRFAGARDASPVVNKSATMLGLAYEAAKATKNKFCPLIQYTTN
jgi:hypothetical protein